MGASFRLNESALRQVERDPDILRAVKEHFGDAILADSQVDVPVDTGELRDSGYSEVQDDRVQVGYEAEHAPFNELGTSKMPARPFLRPAAYKDRGSQHI